MAKKLKQHLNDTLYQKLKNNNCANHFLQMKYEGKCMKSIRDFYNDHKSKMKKEWEHTYNCYVVFKQLK